MCVRMLLNFHIAGICLYLLFSSCDKILISILDKLINLQVLMYRFALCVSPGGTPFWPAEAWLIDMPDPGLVD